LNTQIKSALAGAQKKTKQIASKSAAEHLKPRHSKELIIGLSGPIGSGLDTVKESLGKALAERGYEVVNIKISEGIKELSLKYSLTPHDTPNEEDARGEFKRIWELQTFGNDLRLILGEDVGAQIAMKKIAVHRAIDNPETKIEEIVPRKIAYLIDQLKSPKEIQLLRGVYRNLFYMVGVLSGYERRKKFLSAKMPKHLAERLMERDRKESDDNGQQLEKTLQHAEFFVSNSRNNREELLVSLKRFIGLIHGDNGLTPTPRERGMFAAYTASLRSACLSRQVGAAITDIHGNILSTGCNDVPRAGGGLYEPGSHDQRCVFKDAICHNDKHKRRVRDEVKQALMDFGKSESEAIELAEIIRENTGIKDLIEFSRAVHAEMDAIIGVARTGGARLSGCIMFTTTYPCHSCARHIVAAGIRAVYFIEPYEKSLAADLHDDSISQDPDTDINWDNLESFDRVNFLHFEGVSPQKFTKLFNSSAPRKNNEGVAIQQKQDSDKKIPEFLDDYIELESKVIIRLENHLNPGKAL